MSISLPDLAACPPGGLTAASRGSRLDRIHLDRARLELAHQSVRTAVETERGGTTRTLPVSRALAGLLPDGALRRGSSVAVHGSTALALALIAEASAAGSWCAAVGCPQLGVQAAAEAGIALPRLALVPDPGRQWTETVAALLDGVDIVVVSPPARLGGHEVRRLAARARERGVVVVPLETAARRWEGADVRLTATAGHWEGLESGVGRLRTHRLTVESSGRGAAARPRRAEIWLPAKTAPIQVENADDTRISTTDGTWSAPERRAPGEAETRLQPAS
ncbi:MAG: hypothetical protein ACR2F6_00240 [Mycobacteriales bacterium]